MKRSKVQTKARRARGHAVSPYQKYNKKPYSYPFPTGKNAWEDREKRKQEGK